MDNAFDTLVRKVAESAGVTPPNAQPPKSVPTKTENRTQPTGFVKKTDIKTKTGVTKEQYPLSKNIPEKIKGMTGKTPSDITIESVMNGSTVSDDIRISGDVLRMQADVAETNGKKQFADSLRRAAEMTVIPDERVLEMYDMLRPNRATKKQLMDMAEELENVYSAPMTAAFVRDAAEVYEKRNILLRQ